MNSLVLIGIISFLTSLVSGLLGLGGAVLLIPAYLYLPALFGVQPLDVRAISGLTSLQVLSSSILGMLIHRQRGAVDSRLVLAMGIPIVVSSFSGALISGFVTRSTILMVFAVLAITGAVLLVVRREPPETGMDAPVRFSYMGAGSAAFGVGFFGGMVGAPGAFILSPIMMTILKIPTRVTIGSTLGIVLLSALAASTGKVIAGQVPPLETATAVVCSLPGVYLGSIGSHRIHTRALRWVLAILIGSVGVQMAWKILNP